MKVVSCFIPPFTTSLALLGALVLGTASTALADSDLSVSITSSPNPASVGEALTYTITVTNAGPMAAAGVFLTNKLSDGQMLGRGGIDMTCPDPAPVAWWKGEANAEDHAGNNHGELIAETTFEPGKVGQAFSLDGVDDYVSFPDAPELQVAHFTIEGWFKPTALSSVQILVSKTFGDASSINDSFAIYLVGETLNALVPSSSGGFDILTAPSPLSAGEWFHVAYTFDDAADTHALYLNGVLEAMATSEITLPYDANPVLIGADIESGAPAFFYGGLADEITLFDYVLSAAQLEGIYNADSDGKCAGSTGIMIGELPSQGSRTFTLTVRPTLCGGEVTNIVCVTTTEPDPDEDNNVATHAVTVGDMTPPEVVCADKTVDCGSMWDFDEPAASDLCGSVTLVVLSTETNAVEFCGLTFEATRTWEAMDASGNMARCSQRVTVEDTTVPTLTCEPDKAVSCDEAWEFDAPMASDTCGDVTIAVLGAVTNTLGTGSFEIVQTWEATDACGNAAQCSQTVTLADVTPPVCVADKTVDCGSDWDFDLPTDACGEVVVNMVDTVTNAAGFCGGAFEATRTWEVMDSAGNMMQCIQTVTTEDTTPPLCVPDKAVQCGTVWDFDDPIEACGGLILNIVSTVTNTAGFCGQTFEATRSWEATDGCGHMSQCSQTVTVFDLMVPTCVADKLVECGTQWDFDEPSTEDACGTVMVTVVSTTTNTVDFCGVTFSATRTWELADECGNMGQCSQVVTVGDTIPPVLDCPQDRTVQSGQLWTFDEPIATDSCELATIIIVATVTNVTPAGAVMGIRTWQAADSCGNTSECSQIVSVVEGGLGPELSIRREANMVQICWAATGTAFVLEHASSLNNAGSWVQVSEEPVLTDSIFCVTTTSSESTRYFRLRSP